jgi:hypothetical protein
MAPAVKNFSTVIHTGLTAMEIECMPQDLPEGIVVDLSGIAELGTASASEEIERGKKKLGSPQTGQWIIPLINTEQRCVKHHGFFLDLSAQNPTNPHVVLSAVYVQFKIKSYVFDIVPVYATSSPRFDF